MRISDHFSNNFFKADDFDARGTEYVISSVEMGKAGREEKIILYFDDCDKVLPLNKTNALEIAELYGDDTDDWTGKSIRVYQAKTDFNGKRVPCMRISAPLETAPAQPSGHGSGNRSGKPAQKRGQDSGGEIPF